MKHIISEYDIVDSQQSAENKKSILRTHSLNRLIKHISNEMGYTISDEAEQAMLKIDGFYFTTRYPGEESVILDKKDITNCKKAASLCRDETIRIKELCLDKNKPIEEIINEVKEIANRHQGNKKDINYER